MRYPGRLATIGALAALTSCEPSQITFPDAPNVEGTIVAAGMWIPDGITVIGEGDFLFADRAGDVYLYGDGRTRRLDGIPASRVSSVYGGILDLSAHPDFASNGWVYISYNDAQYRLTVARFVVRDGRVEDFAPVFRSGEFSIGSRIVWQDSDHFFVSFGIGGDPFPDPGPQDLSMDVGKIHRLRADGSVPADNPLFEGASEPTSVWSYGHRNPQGLFYDQATDRLYATEHGPLGGDELNIVQGGRNYGWPLFSYGLNYDRTDVSALTEGEAFAFTEAPEAYWGPNFRVAPSGLAYVQQGAFAEANGTFLIGALYSQDLLRYDPLTGNTDVVLRGVGRVRDIAQLPGGDLLLAVDAGSPGTEDEGRILRLSDTGL
ncbi:MAG: PQQ-dependent sugar dehydrogenase [Gemmatimonadota bacterium]